jgi:hypothetical protein
MVKRVVTISQKTGAVGYAIIVSRYFLKLVGYCLLLAVFPIVIRGIFSYQKASDMVRSNVYEGNVQLLRQMQSTVEQQLHMSDYAATQYCSSPMITQALDMNLDEMYNQTISTENWCNR